MTTAHPTDAATATRWRIIGIVCIIGAVWTFSSQDAGIKWLSGDYPLHEITFIRSVIALIITLAIIIPLEGGFENLKTERIGLHLLRGMTVVAANMAFFTGLASLPLAEATAIIFVSPLFITIFSVLLLSEKVGARRWAAVLVGLAGVMIVMKPGGNTFHYAAILPLIAAICYALLQIMTRKLGFTDKASTMAFYIHLTFFAFSGLVGLLLGDGRLAGSDSANLEFLTRAWIWPETQDILIIGGIGILAALGGYLISQGYRLCPANIGAPFEYAALPMGIAWSIILWGHWPDGWSWIGIALIAGAGLYVFYRETMSGRPVRWRSPIRRRSEPV
ncbi:MAG: DMT family transporter [Rhizobiaceae bacterium]